MKKLVLSVLTILTCGAAYALPVGNPSEASIFTHGTWWEDTSCGNPCDSCWSWCDSWSFRVGFYGDYVFNRHLEVDGDDDDRDNHGRDINRTRMNTNAGYLALNLCNMFDVFATLGATDMHIHTDGLALGSRTSLGGELGFETAFSWSVGARATIWECNCFAVGIEGQYFRTKPDADYFLGYDDGSYNYFTDEDNDAPYHEWQVGLGASYLFATGCPSVSMRPYVAVKWAWSKWDFDDAAFAHNNQTLGLADLKSRKLWGFAVGTTLAVCDTVGVTVEGRWGDETAIFVNGQFRF